MKRGKTYDWIPLHVDKWLWGSTRHELGHPERAIFIDLLALASKDDGYVRANEATPYPVPQLAGMFNAPLELVESTIHKCVQYNKIRLDESGIIYVLNWENYSLSSRQKRRMSAETDAVSGQPDAFSVSLMGSFPNLSSLKREALLWWNKLAEETGLSRIHEIKTESARERSLRARAKEAGFSLQDLADKIRRQPFLLGENDRGWRCDFDWVLNASNFTKIMEEKYVQAVPKAARREPSIEEKYADWAKRPAAKER